MLPEIPAAYWFAVQVCDATMMSMAEIAGTTGIKKPASSETGFIKNELVINNGTFQL